MYFSTIKQSSRHLGQFATFFWLATDKQGELVEFSLPSHSLICINRLKVAASIFNTCQQWPKNRHRAASLRRLESIALSRAINLRDYFNFMQTISSWAASRCLSTTFATREQRRQQKIAKSCRTYARKLKEVTQWKARNSRYRKNEVEIHTQRWENKVKRRKITVLELRFRIHCLRRETIHNIRKH